jgi:hypothetical protein
MKTVDDALAFCARENDPFYVSAFMIEAWLSDVTLKTVDQYADRKSAKNRRLQQGLAAESFAAIIGIQQRHFRDMSDFQKSWWEWHHGEAADRLSDPSKWTMIGKAMADVSSTHQNYPALDECIIMLWPLVRRHHWTYRDLMHVIRSVAPVPLRYPCERVRISPLIVSMSLACGRTRKREKAIRTARLLAWKSPARCPHCSGGL